MSSVLQVHCGLIAGRWGEIVFGLAALLWSVESLIGFYFTFPLRRHASARGRSAGPSWLVRWRPAWTVGRHARGSRLVLILRWPALLLTSLDLLKILQQHGN